MSIVSGRGDGKEGEEVCAKGKPGNLHLFSVSWKFSSVVKTMEYFIFFDFLKDKLLLKEKKIQNNHESCKTSILVSVKTEITPIILPNQCFKKPLPD